MDSPCNPPSVPLRHRSARTAQHLLMPPCFTCPRRTASPHATLLMPTPRNVSPCHPASHAVHAAYCAGRRLDECFFRCANKCRPPEGAPCMAAIIWCTVISTIISAQMGGAGAKARQLSWRSLGPGRKRPMGDGEVRAGYFVL